MAAYQPGASQSVQLVALHRLLALTTACVWVVW